MNEKTAMPASLEHPNIVRSSATTQIDGARLVVMDYVSGIDVRRVWQAFTVGGARLPLSLAAWVARAAARGLAHNGLDVEHGDPVCVVADPEAHRPALVALLQLRARSLGALALKDVRVERAIEQRALGVDEVELSLDVGGNADVAIPLR